MIKHSLYSLTHEEAPRRFDDTRQTWQLPGYQAILVLGDAYGLLSMTETCPCGSVIHEAFFFTKDAEDYIYGTCMRPEFSDATVELFMPGGKRGRFMFESSSGANYNDCRVLNLLVDANNLDMRTAGSFTLECFFDRAQARIRMRTMFNRMYFRCYRLAFAPGMAGAVRESHHFAELCRTVDCDAH